MECVWTVTGPLLTVIAAALCGVVVWAMSDDAAAAAEERQVIELSAAHHQAVNRQRRIVVQYDAGSLFGTDIRQWLDYRFSYIDEPGSQIDSVWWDVGELNNLPRYREAMGEQFVTTGLEKWRTQGVDCIQELVTETRKRDLEVFWHYRISEVDGKPGGGLNLEYLTSLKKAHPDWVIKTWWWQGMWNLAVPEVREHHLGIIRELAETYDFDGFQIDFARHIPCLPPGRQWELRENVTEFMRMVRAMLLELEAKRGRPYLLAAKVPRNLEGCRGDGFDVAAWADQGLVDIFTVGTRSMHVDIAAYRRITAGKNIKLQPCFDDHHTTDAYQYGPIEFLRGVFGNWWQQGADSVVTFNWSNAPPEACEQMGVTPGPLSHQQAYHEVGSPETLAGKDKIFAVERRGGYPWAEGFFGRNDAAPLPVELANDGRPADLTVHICDNLRAYADEVKEVTVRAVLFGAREGDEIELRLNGLLLPLTAEDHEWKDKLIFSPLPQPASGGADHIEVNPEQKLLRLDFAASPRQCHLGENRVSLRVLHRMPYCLGHISLEKLELHVAHK